MSGPKHQNRSTVDTEINSTRLVRAEVSLAGAIHKEELEAKLERGLRRAQLLSDEYIYSAFHPAKLKTVLSVGSARIGELVDEHLSESLSDQDEACVFCVTASRDERRILHLDCDESFSLIDYLEQRASDSLGYLAIYNKAAFYDELEFCVSGRTIPPTGPGPCILLEPNKMLDALIAVVAIRL